MSAIVPGSDAWHALRRTGIGGSDSPAVAGLSRRRTPYAVYLDKIGEAEPEPQTEEQWWGAAQEPLIRRKYGEVTGRLIRQVAFVRSPKYEWLFCNPDGIADDRLLEIKISRFPTGWGEPGSDEIPMEYLVQVHHNLIATGLPLADVAVLIGGSEMRIYTVEPDPIIHAEIIEREEEFWDRVQRRDPPEPVSFADAQARWGRISGKGQQVIADEAAKAAVSHARLLQQEIKHYEKSLEDYKLAIASALKDHGDTLVDAAGNVLATWKMDKGRKAYEVAARGSARKLLIKGEKE